MRVLDPHLHLVLLTTFLLSFSEAGAEKQLCFPTPDRPVAEIISPAYSDEKTRDEKGEADRVMDRLGINPSTRVADIGAGAGYYTVRLARRLGPSLTLYAQDVQAKYLQDLKVRLQREGIRGVKLILGAPQDPKLPPDSIDLALLAHVYHEIENPYEFFFRLQPSIAANGRLAIIDVARPTQDHGTPPALLRCELEALGYRQLHFFDLQPADGYLAVFAPPREIPPVSTIKPCKQ